MSSHNSALLDMEAALARVGGDTELLGEIAALFIGDYPMQLNTLARAIASQDALVVEKSAHTIKGSVATFGAAPAVEAALGLERAGRAQDLSQAPELFSQLESLLTGLRSELELLVP
jgi:HPt (histidine-containing phosphotransfer) domain-containing protein